MAIFFVGEKVYGDVRTSKFVNLDPFCANVVPAVIYWEGAGTDRAKLDEDRVLAILGH